MNRIVVPSIESVERLGDEVVNNKKLRPDDSISYQGIPTVEVFTAIANEVGPIPSGSGLEAVATLFEVEILARVYETATTWSWKRTGYKVKCFNDFEGSGDAIAVDQIIKIIKDSWSPYYQIVVFPC